MKVNKEQIFWNAFEDELSKEAGVLNPFTILSKGWKGAKKWSNTLGHATTLENEMVLAGTGRLAPTQSIVDKVKALPNKKPGLGTIFNPINAVKGAVRNIGHYIDNPKAVIKGELNSLRVQRSEVGATAGKSIKRTYNPFQSGWKMRGVKNESERAGLQGLQDIVGAAAKPLVGQGAIGLAGAYGIGRVAGLGKGQSASEALAFNVAPAASTLAILGKTSYDIGKGIIKNKNTRKTVNKNFNPRGNNAHLEKTYNNYGTY